MFLIFTAELGDYDAEEHLSRYVHEVKCLPQLNDVKAQAIADIHKTLAYVTVLLRIDFVFQLKLINVKLMNNF